MDKFSNDPYGRLRLWHKYALHTKLWRLRCLLLNFEITISIVSALQAYALKTYQKAFLYLKNIVHVAGQSNVFCCKLESAIAGMTFTKP